MHEQQTLIASPCDPARLGRDLGTLLDEIRVSIAMAQTPAEAFAIFEVLRPFPAELALMTTAAIVRADGLL